MKVRFVAPAVAAVALLILSSSANAGLFSHHGCSSCGSEPVCGVADACDTCCAAEPTCGCDPCASSCGHRPLGLFARLKCHKRPLFGCHRGCGAASCCEPVCGCEAACEPACGCEVAVEPACGCEAACEPACGCEAAPCCGPKLCGGGLLKRLFAHKHRLHSSCCEPTCGCEAACEPSCGCN